MVELEEQLLEASEQTECFKAQLEVLADAKVHEEEKQQVEQAAYATAQLQQIEQARQEAQEVQVTMATKFQTADKLA